ncbi:MAG: MmgE/PrpD family protein [Thermodesulfobacteriota bacterium]|nr:MmgE/PrpD family protein [Thermodesulfobacteriota bacterium]
MTLPRDLAWQNLDLVYRSSISYQFARYALRLNYDMLPKDVIHQAKRSLLDTLGCAIGAYVAPGRLTCEAVARELDGPEEATVFCSGMRTSALNATLVNSFLVRYLDYNDMGGGGHNSDAISGILAVSEREKTDGRAFLTSVVISYELGERVKDSALDPSVEAKTSRGQWKGWTNDCRGGLTMPPALGKLMRLNEDQIANAIGICASHSLPMGIHDTDREENTMTKNLRFGFVVYDAILACMLAKKGFTGPVRVVEGESGFRQVILQGNMDLERLVDFSGWRILRTMHKSLCANSNTQGHILATIAIVKEHDLKPEDIVSVRIRTGLRDARHTTTFSKKYPRNAENADHSAFYANAIAIKERAFGPESIEPPEKFFDPVVLDLIEKITVEADPTMPENGYQGMSEITTKDGRRFQKRVDQPHGFGNDPLTDKELEDKFRSMAIKYMDEKQIKTIFDTVWNVEKVDHMSKLASLMVFPKK